MLGVLAALSFTAPVWGAAASRQSKAAEDFDRVIRPILSENCYKCHGPNEGERKAKLRFDLRADALKPAKSGKLPIVPGDPAQSEMITRITAADADDRMRQQAKTGKTLSPAQIETLGHSIAQGAPYPTHWAYVKPSHPAVPAVRARKWPRNPIDAFILARLEKEGLLPSPARRSPDPDPPRVARSDRAAADNRGSGPIPRGQKPARL